NGGNVSEVVRMLFEVGFEVVQSFEVGVHTFGLGVGHEHHPIYPAQDQFSAGIVENLSGDGIEVKSGLKSADCPQIERQKVEEEGSVGFGCQRDHFAFLIVAGLIKNVLQIRRFAAEAGAVIDDFAVDFAGCEIDKAQKSDPRFW